MSIYYQVNEHLSINNTEKLSETIHLTVHQLSLLGALMLRGDAAFNSLTLVAGGKSYSFKGTKITPRLHELLDTLKVAESIELIADYEYWY